MAKRAHVIVSGEVQGVFFRATTRKEAERRHVDGWVRNMPDGRVEAVFEGHDHAVDAMVEWCHGGPPQARVEDVEVEWTEPEGDLDGFSVKVSSGGD